jgi:hypothetical protein
VIGGQLQLARRPAPAPARPGVSNAARSTPVIQPKLLLGAPGDRYEREADAAARLVVEHRTPPPVHRVGEARVQRYLFGGAKYAGIKAYQQAIGGSFPKRLDPVKQILKDYVAHHPAGEYGPLQPSRMDAHQLAAVRAQLEALLAGIDTALLGPGKALSEQAAAGTEVLRTHVDQELMTVVKAQHLAGVFARQRVAFMTPAERTATKANAQDFVAWLDQHPRYLRWKGQGAGACADASRDLVDMLHTTLFTGHGEQSRVKVAGIVAHPPVGSDVDPANHIVTVVDLGSGRLVIDPTQGQFLGGRPMTAAVDQWKEVISNARVAFRGGRYLRPSRLQIRTFLTVDEALQFASNPDLAG